MAPARFALAAKKKAAKSSKKAEVLGFDWTLPLVALVSLFVGGMIEGRCARYFRKSATADDYSLA